mgnify:FL=1
MIDFTDELCYNIIMNSERLILGYTEKIKIKKIDGARIDAPFIWAKIDTGAFSGVVHAENIIENDDKLEFDLFGNKALHMVIDDYETRYVRNTHGGRKQRYLADLTFEIDGREYKTKIGLDDRNKMKFDALLGRYFINSESAIVDTQKNIENDIEWKELGE